MGEGDGAAVVKGEVDGAGGGVEGCGADGGSGGVGATVDFHVGFGREEAGAVGVDSVGCGCFVGGEDGESAGEEGSLVDVEEKGLGGGRLGGIGGGGALEDEVVGCVRGFVGDGGWSGTPDLWGGVVGRSVGGGFGGREGLAGGVHLGIWRRWEQNDIDFLDCCGTPCDSESGGHLREGFEGDV